MATIAARAFTKLFYSQVIDICANLSKLAECELTLTGAPGLDEQQDLIVQKYYDFVASLRDPCLTEKRSIKFQELVAYIGLHFTIENSLMEMVQYPKQVLHRKQHTSFIDRINIIILDVHAEKAPINDLVLYIGHWLLGHVLIADREFADFQATINPPPLH